MPDEADEGSAGLIEAFLSTYDRARTRKAYGHDLRDFFGAGPEEVLSKEKALGPSEEDVQAYLRRVRSEKGPAAARRRKMAIRAFYKWLVRRAREAKAPASAEEASAAEALADATRRT